MQYKGYSTTHAARSIQHTAYSMQMQMQYEGYSIHHTACSTYPLWGTYSGRSSEVDRPACLVQRLAKRRKPALFAVVFGYALSALLPVVVAAAWRDTEPDDAE